MTIKSFASLLYDGYNFDMQEEKTSQRTHKKIWKYIVLLFIGVFITIIAIDIETGNLYKYNILFVIGYILCYVSLCFLGIGLIALIASKIMGGVKKYWFPIFTWLFLIVVVFDIGIESINKIIPYNNVNQPGYLMSSSSVPSEQEASGPNPPDGAIHKDTCVSLSWIHKDSAVSFDVYFSDNSDDVKAGAEAAFQGNQNNPVFVVGFPRFPYPDGLVPGTTYYWRIDEVNDVEPNSPWKGPVWSFSISPNTAYPPYRDYMKSKNEAKKADNSTP